MRFTMIPVEQRSKWHCYYCGETRSVKYIFHSNGTALPVCNRCAAKIGTQKEMTAAEYESAVASAAAMSCGREFWEENRCDT